MMTGLETSKKEMRGLAIGQRGKNAPAPNTLKLVFMTCTSNSYSSLLPDRPSL